MPDEPKTQREKFEQAARQAETDDREEVFDAALVKVASAAKATEVAKKREGN